MEYGGITNVLLLVLLLLLVLGAAFRMAYKKIICISMEMRAGGVDIGNISMRYEALLSDYKLWEEWEKFDKEVEILAENQTKEYLENLVESTRGLYSRKRRRILKKVGNL